MPSIQPVILARGGSKGIPGKNLQLVGGRSLVERAIDAVRRAGLRPMVSTDDDDIAEVAAGGGALVVRRPDALSGDEVSSEAALLHAADTLGMDDDDFILLVQCTAPFLDPGDVTRVVDALVAGADSAFAATSFHRFVWAVDADGPRGVNHDLHGRARRQDREPEWLEAGSVYGMKVGGLRVHQHRFFGEIRIVPIVGSDLEIDTPADLDLARRISSGTASTSTWPWPDRPRLVLCDFDGVLTDDRVWTDQDGVESVVCSRGDGLGLSLLREEYAVAVISTEVNPVVARRCAKLEVPCIQGVGRDKGSAVTEIAGEHGVPLSAVAFVGNDVNDLAALEIVGFPVAVSDAHPRVREAAGLVLDRPGGRGAVRQLADLLLALTDP